MLWANDQLFGRVKELFGKLKHTSSETQLHIRSPGGAKGEDMLLFEEGLGSLDWGDCTSCWNRYF